MIRHSANAIQFRLMIHDVAVNIGIKFAFMLLIYSRDAAMSTKYDMIDKMGITHDGTKVRRMLQLHKTFQAMGSPSATFTSPAMPVVPATVTSVASAGAGTTGVACHP